MTKIKNKSRNQVLFLLLSTLLILTIFGSLAPLDMGIEEACAQPSYIPFKWLLIQDDAVSYYGDYLGLHQFAENFVRNLGVPFDSVLDNTVSDDTFWDSANQRLKYQAFAYFGHPLTASHIPKATAINSMKKAIYNGTNAVIIASAIEGWSNFWGITSVGDLNSDQSITFTVTTTFTAINGTVYNSGFSRTTHAPAYRQITTSGLSGNATLYINATWTGAWAVQTARIDYGGGVAWWWSGTQGVLNTLLSKRNGYEDLFGWHFEDTVNRFDRFQHVRQILFTAFYDCWKCRVGIMPWQRRGSAILGKDDQFFFGAPVSTAVFEPLISRGLPIDLATSVEGGRYYPSQSINLNLTEYGSGFPSYTATGYRFFGSWTVGYYGPTVSTGRIMVFSRLNNITQLTHDSFMSITANNSQTVNFVDGNSTVLRKVQVYLSTSAIVNWQLRVIANNGSVLYTSANQTAQLVSPTWVTFKPNNTIPQATIKLQIRVFSGTVSWQLNSSNPYAGGQLEADANSDACFVALGGSHYDIGIIDADGNDVWDDGETTMARLTMANGALYPAQNRSYIATAFPFPNNERRWVLTWVVGRTSTSPTSVVLGWLVTKDDWFTTSSGNMTRNVVSTLVDDYGFRVVFQLRHQHKFQDSVGQSSDYFWNHNASAYSYDYIKNVWQSMYNTAKDIYGESRIDKVETAPYSGASYPPDAIYSTTQGAGAFYEVGVVVAWSSSLRVPQTWGIWGHSPNGFKRCYATAPYDGGSNLPIDGPAGAWSAQFLATTYGVAQTIPWRMPSVSANWYDNNWLPSYKQDYETTSIWWAGTTMNAFQFWNGSRHMLMNTTQADMNGTTATLKFWAPTTLQTFVWKFPLKIGSYYLQSVTDNRTIGRIVKTDGSTVFVEFSQGAGGWHQITVNYGTNPRTFSWEFTFNHRDKDLNTVDSRITWQLYNDSQLLSYTEGQCTLLDGTYTLRTYYHGKLINTTSLSTARYGNSTINIDLQMKAHTSVSNGYIAFNNTITSIIINSQTATNLTFTVTGSGAYLIDIDVPANASYVRRNGLNQAYGSVWTYDPSTKRIRIITASLSISTWELIFPGQQDDGSKKPSNNNFNIALALLSLTIIATLVLVFVRSQKKRKQAICRGRGDGRADLGFIIIG